MPKGSSVETPLYLLRGRRMEESAAEWQQALAELHGSPERPRCLCIPGGVDMYRPLPTQTGRSLLPN